MAEYYHYVGSSNLPINPSSGTGTLSQNDELIVGNGASIHATINAGYGLALSGNNQVTLLGSVAIHGRS
jgi:hypothetical protein